MAQTVQTPGGGIAATTVKVGISSPPTTEVGCQVTITESEPNPQYVTVPPTGCQAGRQVYTGTQRNLHLQWLQDWGAADSMSEFLDDHDGETIFAVQPELSQLQFSLEPTLNVRHQIDAATAIEREHHGLLVQALAELHPRARPSRRQGRCQRRRIHQMPADGRHLPSQVN